MMIPERVSIQKAMMIGTVNKKDGSTVVAVCFLPYFVMLRLLLGRTRVR